MKASKGKEINVTPACLMTVYILGFGFSSYTIKSALNEYSKSIESARITDLKHATYHPTSQQRLVNQLAFVLEMSVPLVGGIESLTQKGVKVRYSSD